MQRQFEYLCAQTQEWGAEHNLFRTASLSALYGDTSETMVIVPLSAKRHASSPTRRTLSARSALEKPRSRLSPKWSYSKLSGQVYPEGSGRAPVRMLSPSSLYTLLPCCNTSCSCGGHGETVTVGKAFILQGHACILRWTRLQLCRDGALAAA